MRFSADRVSGTLFLVFGLALYFLIIPGYVEIATDGNISPNTMPNILAVILALLGGLLVFKPTLHSTQTMRSFAITAAYVAILVVGIYAMSLFGFVYVGPVMALAIMLMIGERRPLWLVSGVVAMPALIWFFVVYVLGRALP
tara:strand:- start:1599 stop:2024 length:426 start_codon:yes stop_codon:yes gene_type:complete